MTSQTRARAAIILAAGQGTRMKSPLPKVMHAVGGRPMMDWSIALAREVGAERIVAVVPRPSSLSTQTAPPIRSDHANGYPNHYRQAPYPGSDPGAYPGQYPYPMAQHSAPQHFDREAWLADCRERTRGVDRKDRGGVIGGL